VKITFEGQEVEKGTPQAQQTPPQQAPQQQAPPPNPKK
jgi:hypothetical protein